MSVWSASLSQRFDERADDIPGPGAYDANYENHHVSNTSSSGFRIRPSSEAPRLRHFSARLRSY